MTCGYLDEVFEQPAALRRCGGEFPSGQKAGLMRIKQRMESGGFDRIVLTGMGASLHGCYPLYLKLSSDCPTPVILWDASELAHFAPHLLTEKTLLIAVSQSGESAELRRIADRKKRPGLVVSITNGETNILANWADVPLLTRAGVEATVSSKTYTAGLAILHLLGSALLGEDIEAAREEVRHTASALASFLQDLNKQTEHLADHLGSVDFLAFIGRGPSLASARAGSLITQEASKLPCTAYSGGGFRHGPLELTRPGFKAVVFAGVGGAAALNLRLAGQICEAGGTILFISSAAGGNTVRERMAIVQIPAVAPALLPILEIMPVQLLTIPLAQAKGYEPAVFERASKITAVE